MTAPPALDPPLHPPSTRCSRPRVRRYMSSRFTFPSTPITPAWPTLPFDGLQSVFSGTLDGNSIAFALASTDLFMSVRGHWLPVSSFGASLPIVHGSAASPASLNGTDGIVLAVPGGLHFVRCDWTSPAPSKCASDHILALPFGAVRSVAAAGAIVLVAPVRGGLFAFDLSSDTCAAAPRRAPHTLVVPPTLRPHT